jgi:hypothetical protein
LTLTTPDPPNASFSPPSLAFGNQQTGTASAPLQVTVENTGQLQLQVTERAISGPNASDFAISGGSCPVPPFGLGAHESCTVAAIFTPTATGTREALLRFTHNAAGSPHDVALSGSGIAVESPPPGSGTPSPTPTPTPTPELDTTAPKVTFKTTSVTATPRGYVRIPIVCPAVEPDGFCGGRLRLVLLNGTTATAAARIVGTKSFTVTAGATKKVRLRLTRYGRQRLARLRVRAIARMVDKFDNVGTTRRKLTIRRG